MRTVHTKSVVTVVALVMVSGCAQLAERSGQRASQGALRAAAAKLRQVDPNQLTTLIETKSGAAVTGALSQLGGAEQQAQLEQAVAVAAAAALRGVAEHDRDALVRIANLAAVGAIGAVTRELHADGSLRREMTATTREISASAIAGARDALALVFPECSDGDRRQCVERRIAELSHAVSAGVARGLVDGLRFESLAFAFGAGALLTLIAVYVARGVRVPRRGSESSSA
jgi:hypothetical protein